MAESTMPDAGELLMLKHDIKNQLSNIQLAIEGLRFELTDRTDDTTLYLTLVSDSARKIDELLKIIQPRE